MVMNDMCIFRERTVSRESWFVENTDEAAFSFTFNLNLSLKLNYDLVKREYDD
jgi:hypothetical protein